MYFNGFQLIFQVMFLFVLGVFAATFIKNIGAWHKNNRSPRLTVEATVVAKRTNVTRHRHDADDMHYSTSTYYYVTFQVESGDRMEFSMPGREYGLIVEGDKGRLSFQGTRFISFERM